jgi:hypothetical protein
MSGRTSARILLVLGAVLALGLLLDALLQRADVRLPYGEQISVSDVRTETGRAYTGRLSETVGGSVLLFLVETRPGGPFHRLHSHFGDSYLLGYLAALWERRFWRDTYEVWTPLGPGGANDDEIRRDGNGRYAVSRDSLRFSLPDGRGLSGRDRLVVVRPPYDPVRLAAALADARRVLEFGTLALAAVMASGLAAAALRAAYRASSLFRAVAPGVAVSGALLLALVAGGEAYLRATTPFLRNTATWPANFDPQVGWLFRPGAEIRATNGLDFWSIQHANSLGFLDAEPAIPKPAGTFRILLVGDSFVEAQQVPLEGKLQTVLSGLLKARGGAVRYDVVALGQSGTGQANQLAYLERYKDALKPDLVVLAFVNNDFANNAPLLEAIRNGWDPEHLPRLFLAPEPSTGIYRHLPVDPNWWQYSTPGGTDAARTDSLRNRSQAYRAKLDGWDPQRLHMDNAFYEDRLAPVFEDALDATRAAFAAFKRHAEHDGFGLVVMATDNVVGGPVSDDRRFNQLRRLQAMLDGLHIPLLDLYPEFVARGGQKKAQWKHDGHWNETGHRWAAEALCRFLDARHMLDPDSRGHEAASLGTH